MNKIELKKFISKEVNLLFEAFEFRNDNKSFIPPLTVKKVAEEAQNVLNSRPNPLQQTDDNKNEGTGTRKAQDLISQRPHNHGELKRLKAFFDNNVDKINAEKNSGKDMHSSDDILIWNLHGGDEGKRWADSEIEKTNNSNLRTKKNMRIAGGANTNKGMGTFDTTMMDTTKQRIHR